MGHDPPASILLKRRQALDDAVALRDIQNSLVANLVVPQPWTSVFKEGARAKFNRHTQIIARPGAAPKRKLDQCAGQQGR